MVFVGCLGLYTPHQNADRLDIATIFGYECVIGKGTFSVGDLAAFVEPDYEIPLQRKEFEFLKKPENSHKEYLRIKLSRFRGIVSEGLLIPAKPEWVLGQNVIIELGVRKYEPKTNLSELKGSRKGSKTQSARQPKIYIPTYDVEPFKKYGKKLFSEEARCIVSKKIHGANARFVFHDGEMFVGSRNRWVSKVYENKPKIKYKAKSFITKYIINKFFSERVECNTDWWWNVYAQNPWIGEWCKVNPGHVLFGEVYGPSVQGTRFSYGKSGQELGFKAFDVYDTTMKEYWPMEEFMLDDSIEDKVEVVYDGPLHFDGIHELANSCHTGDQICEGVVIYQRGHKLKYISEAYDKLY